MARVCDLKKGARVLLRNFDAAFNTKRFYGIVLEVDGRKALVEFENGVIAAKDCTRLIVVGAGR